MKAAAKFLAFLAIVFVAMIMAGNSMDPRHTITRSMSYAAPPEKVWSALLSIQQLPFDRSDLRSVDQGAATKPPETIEVVGTPVRVVFETFRPPRDLSVRTADPGLAYTGTWSFVLTLEGQDLTKLTITEDAFVKGRLLRFAARALRAEDFLLDGIFRAVRRKIVETPRSISDAAPAAAREAPAV